MTDLLDFEAEIDIHPETRIVRAVTRVPVVVERVRIHQENPTYIANPEAEWDWRDLRAYVVTQIQDRFGAFPRNEMKEIGIFKGFLNRHGAGTAARIAKHVFEIENGRWRGAPVRVSRFCAISDPYFADVIKDYLAKNG